MIDPRDQVENAVTAAFRLAVGWCPVRDGCRPGERYANFDDNGLRWNKDSYEVPAVRPAPCWIVADPVFGVRSAK